MFLELTKSNDRKVLINSKMIISITFGADLVNGGALIKLIDDTSLTVDEGFDAFKDINCSDG